MYRQKKYVLATASTSQRLWVLAVNLIELPSSEIVLISALKYHSTNNMVENTIRKLRAFFQTSLVEI